ncbi:MAG: bifunctional folylpolyglutamate synthase/dihydrofolate synthase [Anaerolineales bacterium]
MPTSYFLKLFLESLPDLGARPQLEMRSNDFTLERISELVIALGHPERNYPSFHVAGTNGKGSVCAFLSAALRQQGYKAGLFTSPHSWSAREGIRIDGTVVGDEQLQETFDVMAPHLKGRRDWTQFEIVTALALLYFSRQQVDVAVIEVGLGGRLDATNVMEPLVSVITPIDLEHTSILGSTLEEIAREKAGIIKAKVPVVIGPQQLQARKTILEVAKANSSKAIEVGKDWLFERGDFDLGGQDLRIWHHSTPDQVVALPIGLHGAHQIVNAATAYAALLSARDQGLTLSEVAIERGFAAARWPGRFEILRESPALILDAAHTPEAAKALRQALDDYFPGKSVNAVLGVSADKNLAGLIEPMRERLGRVIATQSPHPRAMPAGRLSIELKSLGIDVEPQPSPRKSLEKVLRDTPPDGVVLIWGSVFLVEEVREFVEEINMKFAAVTVQCNNEGL